MSFGHRVVLWPVWVVVLWIAQDGVLLVNGAAHSGLVDHRRLTQLCVSLDISHSPFPMPAPICVHDWPPE